MAEPTMSAIESTAPTSWKCTFSTRRAMDLGLRFGQTREDPLGQLALPRRKLPAIDHLRDLVQVPMCVLGRMLDDDLRGAEAVLVDLLHHEFAVGQTERADPARIRSASTPASIRAPSVISPLMPLAQSR